MQHDALNKLVVSRRAMSHSAPAEVVPEPLRTVLQDYLHVEWYELNELAVDVKNSAWNERVGPFKDQLRRAILDRTLSLESIRALTLNEFEDEEQLNAWLSMIWETLYEEAL